jgi:hypothetical protein
MNDTLGKLNEALRPSNKIDDICIAPIKCSNGVVMSVQASRFHYCNPRNDQGPWETVEVGYPSEKIDDLMPFAVDKRNPTDTVYAHVPIEVVAKIIDESGGFCLDT